MLEGGELNRAGVRGLAMYFSKDGAPFKEMGETVLAKLRDRSEGLNRLVKKTLLQSVRF